MYVCESSYEILKYVPCARIWPHNWGFSLCYVETPFYPTWMRKMCTKLFIFTMWSCVSCTSKPHISLASLDFDPYLSTVQSVGRHTWWCDSHRKCHDYALHPATLYVYAYKGTLDWVPKMNVNQHGNSYRWWNLFWWLHIQHPIVIYFLKWEPLPPRPPGTHL